MLCKGYSEKLFFMLTHRFKGVHTVLYREKPNSVKRRVLASQISTGVNTPFLYINFFSIKDRRFKISIVKFSSNKNKKIIFWGLPHKKLF